MPLSNSSLPAIVVLALDVEHRVLEVTMDLNILIRCSRSVSPSRAPLEKLTDIAPRPFTSFVRIVSRWAIADRPRCSAVEPAEIIGSAHDDLRDILAVLRAKSDLVLREDIILEDDVVSWTPSSYDGSVRLEEEIPDSIISDSVVDKGTVCGVNFL